MYSDILLTGGSGLLGCELLQIAPDLISPSHAEFDITMEKFSTEHSFSAIIHGAAFTSPPKVDEDPITAMNVNITGTANLVTLAARHNIRLIYISTDYVFKGVRGNNHEDDEVLPQNLYH